MSLAHRIRLAARRLGVDVSRFPDPDSTESRRSQLLSGARVDLLLDIGAARGEYVLGLREHGWNGRAISFEPLPQSFAILERASAPDGGWTARQEAVGATVSEVTVNVAANGDSSSVLAMRQTHLDAAPHSRYVDAVTVQQTTVADVLDGEGSVRAFLKIDVQGYEAQVLKGARAALDRVVGLELELSLVELYEGQQLLTETLESVTAMGFEPVRLTPGFTDPRSGRMLQADGIFLRRD